MLSYTSNTYEGFITYFIIIVLDVLDTKRRIWGYLMVLGWGFPLPFVITALALTQGETYISEESDYCWLSTDEWIIWLFLGPIYFLIIVNTFIFISIIFRLCQVKRNKNKKTKQNGKILVIKETLIESILMTFVLGLPWVITLAKILTHFFEGNDTSFYADKVIDWLFIMINFPAGIVLLIIVVLKYRGISSKKVSYISNNAQSELESTVEAVKKTLPRPKPKLINIPQALRFSKQEAPNEARANSYLGWKLKQLGNSLSSKIHASFDRDYSIDEVHENPGIAKNHDRTLSNLHVAESGAVITRESPVRLLTIPRQFSTNYVDNQEGKDEKISSL